jgi:hypothetical protein
LPAAAPAQVERRRTAATSKPTTLQRPQSSMAKMRQAQRMLSHTDTPAVKTPYGHKTEQTKSDRQGPCHAHGPARPHAGVMPAAQHRSQQTRHNTVKLSWPRCFMSDDRDQQGTTVSQPIPSTCTANKPAQYPLLALAAKQLFAKTSSQCSAATTGKYACSRPTPTAAAGS